MKSVKPSNAFDSIIKPEYIRLIETARSLLAPSHLDGFDISDEQFADKGWLPKNVTLNTLDSLAPMPEHLVGK